MIGLRYPADMLTLGHLLLTAACYWLALAHSLLWTPVAVFVGMHLIAVAHNQAHCPVFRGKRANEVLDYVIGVLSGSPILFWRVHHLGSHHRFTWKEGDWSSPFNFHNAKTPDQPVSYRYYQFVYYPIFCFQSTVYILRSQNRALLRSLLGTTMAVAATALTLMWLFGPWRWLVVVGTTYAFGGMMLGAANYFEHWSSHAAAGEYSSWTFLCPIHNFLGYNGGYHLLHHLRPTLHWSLLAEAHRADPSYSPPDLIEPGLFPGYRGRKGYTDWFEKTQRAWPVLELQTDGMPASAVRQKGGRQNRIGIVELGRPGALTIGAGPPAGTA